MLSVHAPGGGVSACRRCDAFACLDPPMPHRLGDTRPCLGPRVHRWSSMCWAIHPTCAARTDQYESRGINASSALRRTHFVRTVRGGHCESQHASTTAVGWDSNQQCASDDLESLGSRASREEGQDCLFLQGCTRWANTSTMDASLTIRNTYFPKPLLRC